MLILPKNLVEVPDITPLYFLAGPIRGGGDWQATAFQLLQKHDPGCAIACPSRWDHTHPLFKNAVAGKANAFDRQLAWERYYLELAGIHHPRGCILFWLPLESETRPHPGPEPYAMDTRGELGEWRMRIKHEGARVVIGGERGFHGLSQIERNFSHIAGTSFVLYNDLESTIQAAKCMAYISDPH